MKFHVFFDLSCSYFHPTQTSNLIPPFNLYLYYNYFICISQGHLFFIIFLINLIKNAQVKLSSHDLCSFLERFLFSGKFRQNFIENKKAHSNNSFVTAMSLLSEINVLYQNRTRQQIYNYSKCCKD